LGGRLTNGEDGVAEPAHAEIAELFIEELDAKLTGEKGNVFNDSEAHAPLLVLGQLNNSREERLRKKVDADD
jgi:hypothetical protein